MEKNNSLKNAIIVVIVSLVVGFIGKNLFNPSVSFDKQLLTVANEINKTCPIIIDKNTRLDNVMAGPGKTFTYYYSVINYSIDELDLEIISNSIRPNIVNNYRSNPDFQIYRETK